MKVKITVTVEAATNDQAAFVVALEEAVSKAVEVTAGSANGFKAEVLSRSTIEAPPKAMRSLRDQGFEAWPSRLH